MADVVGLTIVKKMTYRGDATEEWSNQYWLTGAVPADAAEWEELFDALVAQEKTVYPSSHAVVAGYGYDTDAENPSSVWSIDKSGAPVVGTYSTNPSYPYAPGDAAGWVRWKTSRLNTKGKPIYLRKYFHGVKLNTSGGGDAIDTAQVTAYNAFGDKLMDGSFLDARTLRSRLNNETLLTRLSSTYATTRTLKRRGKRPSS